jgi:hypothetical protein
MRLLTSAMFALVALLTLFVTTTASPYSDAIGSVSLSMAALSIMASKLFGTPHMIRRRL